MRPYFVQRIFNTEEVELFGKKLSFSLKTEISNSNRNGKYLEHLADFERKPAILYYHYGTDKGSITLNSLKQKRILLDGSKTKDILEQEKYINFKNCLKLFDGIKINIDLSQNNIGYQINKSIFADIIIAYGTKSYIINGKSFNDINERCLIWAFSKEYEYETDHFIKGNNGKYYKFESASLEEQRNNIIKRYKDFVKEDLSNWSLNGKEIGGTELANNEIIPLLSLSIPLLVVNRTATVGLLNNNPNAIKRYRFKDAQNEKEKINQLINRYRSPMFIKEQDNDSVIVGWSDNYIDQVLNDYFNNDFLKV